jgi:hypothetical protein
MSQPSRRERILTDLEGLLASGGRAAPPERLVAAVGRASRVACGDDEEGLGLPERADALLERAREIFGNVAPPSAEALTLGAPRGEVSRWLTSTRGPFSSALTELDDLGALAAGLEQLAPHAPAAGLLSDRIAELERAFRGRARDGQERRAMFEAAMAASSLITERGVHPEHDRALLALADVVGAQLSAALGGEPLDDDAWRVRAVEPGVAERLGALLARALERPNPLAIAPDMVELAAQGSWRAPASIGDLVLHEGSLESAAKAERVELLPGVFVRPLEGELEVETAPGAEAPCLLVLVGGEPGEPCPAREGHRAGQLVFTLAPEAEGYALVAGERVALLRRRGA